MLNKFSPGSLRRIAASIGRTSQMETSGKDQALFNHLAKEWGEWIVQEEIESPRPGEDTFVTPHGDFLVLTEDEAYEKAAQIIADSLWNFNANFIVDTLNLPPDAESMITDFQEANGEEANDKIMSLIEDFPAFVQAVIEADGLGTFLSPYDERVNQSGEYLIFRTN